MAASSSSEKPRVYRSVFISLVAISRQRANTNQHEYVVTLERDGYYMPAGRVDFGETFTTGGKREALEEAGLDVDLNHLICIQFSLAGEHCRLRAVFSATQRNPAQKTRGPDRADHEIIEASYMTLEEIDAIPKNKTRSTEFRKLFHWIDAGAPMHSVDVFGGQNGPLIDNARVQTLMTYRIAMVIVQNNNILVNATTSKLPESWFPHPSSVHETAAGILTDGKGPAVPATKLIRFHHTPPESFPTTGNITFYLTADAAAAEHALTATHSTAYKWVPLAEFAKEKKAVSATDCEVVEKFAAGQLSGVSMSVFGSENISFGETA